MGAWIYIRITNINVSDVKKLPGMQETWASSLGLEDPLEKGMATHSSIRENPMDRGA